jgi:hypothetical protein
MARRRCRVSGSGCRWCWVGLRAEERRDDDARRDDGYGELCKSNEREERRREEKNAVSTRDGVPLAGREKGKSEVLFVGVYIAFLGRRSRESWTRLVLHIQLQHSAGGYHKQE